MGPPSPRSDKVSVSVRACVSVHIIETHRAALSVRCCRRCQTRPSRSHTHMAVESPVVDFELVDKDLHRASDLVDLQQQLSFFFFVRAYSMKKEEKKISRRT